MKKNTSTNVVRLSLLALALLLAASPVMAGGPLLNCESGVPFAWRNAGIDIIFNPDQGALGPQSNATAVANTMAAFQAWTDIPTATISHVLGAQLPVNVDETNFGPFLNPVGPDGLNSIIYDEDGAIFDLLFGPGSGVLGFASPEFADLANCEIIEGVSFLNGGSILDGFPEADFVQVHEYGHYQNLAHTVVNGEVAAFGDATGPSPNNTFPPESLLGRIETMYPFALVGGGQETPHPDDIAMLSTLYPEPGFFSSTGSISGTILGLNGTTRISGINVIARNVANPYDDAVSAISGDFTDDFSQSDPVAGTYRINGLTPGASYVVFTDSIDAGGFSTDPTTPPGPEDCRNTAESTDGNIDDPSVCTPIAVAAGSVVTGVDIAFNAPSPGAPLPLGDDDSIELPLPFTFEVCGQEFETVFVNSNGSLTFGAGDANFTETAAAFLTGPPRIAGLWDDLSPNAGGQIFFDTSSSEFSVTFENVPEFPATGANNFKITLKKNSGFIEVRYPSLTATDGLAGLTCGAFITTGLEQEIDLRPPYQTYVFRSVVNTPAAFQVFNGDIDLEGSIITYQSLGVVFRDNFENNNNLTNARFVGLPFSSEPFWFFTDINPVGADVDYYRFYAQAGRTLIAEVRTGNVLDSVLGLFDHGTGQLLAVDDDGGTGLLSRIVFEIPSSGIYSLAVSAFDDLDFTGDGASGGRYVLDIETIDGTLVNLPDDGSEEVALGFSFPFQGQNYSSVFINSNGNLTFGGGDGNFLENVSDLLNGLPRIAPLWDDLSPNNGGLVITQQGSGTFSVTFSDVPEFFATGANNFTVTLSSSGSVVIQYGSVTALDGIVAVSPGGGAADPGETDLSAGGSLSASGVTYEQFGSGDAFDLSGTTLTFNP